MRPINKSDHCRKITCFENCVVSSVDLGKMNKQNIMENQNDLFSFIESKVFDQNEKRKDLGTVFIW